LHEELDEHFEYPVVDAVKQVNTFCRDRLHELLSPIKRYGVIYADPPWNFKNFSETGTGRKCGGTP